MRTKQEEWVDSYFKLVDDGESNDTALTKVCFKHQLSSYDEDLLKELVK